MTSPKHSRSVACFHVISLFNKVYQRISWRDTLFEAQHLFSRTNNSFLSGHVLSSFMSNVWWSQWLAGTPERHHSKDEVSSTAQRRNGDGWDMLGMGHWPTWSTNPKNKKTRLQTINDKQPDRHWPKQLQYIPIISPCLPPRLTHYVGIPSYHQMNISSWFLYPQLK